MLFNKVKIQELAVKYVETKDKEVLGELCLEFKEWIERTAYKMTCPSTQTLIDDLVSEGLKGIVEHAHKYEPKQASFMTWIVKRVRGSMFDYLRIEDITSRSERQYSNTFRDIDPETIKDATPEQIAKDTGIPLKTIKKFLLYGFNHTVSNIGAYEEMYGSQYDGTEGREGDKSGCCLIDAISGGSEIDSSLTDLIENDVLNQLICGLSQREQLIIKLRYVDDLEMKAIGKVVGVTESRISQQHAQILVRLKDKINGLRKTQAA